MNYGTHSMYFCRFCNWSASNFSGLKEEVKMIDKNTRKYTSAYTPTSSRRVPRRREEGGSYSLEVQNVRKSSLYSGGDIIASDKLVQGRAATVCGEKAAEQIIQYR